jgi:hypothetical protein
MSMLKSIKLPYETFIHPIRKFSDCDPDANTPFYINLKAIYPYFRAIKKD